MDGGGGTYIIALYLEVKDGLDPATTRPSSAAGTGSWGSWMLFGSCRLPDLDSWKLNVPPVVSWIVPGFLGNETKLILFHSVY